MISWLPLLVSVLSLIVAFGAFWNSRKTRLNSESSTVFQIQLDAIKAAKTVETEWQNAINELYHVKQRLQPLGSQNPVFLRLNEYFDPLENFFKSAQENASTVRASVEDKACSAEHAKNVLKVAESAKVTLAQNLTEMRKKLNLLEDTVMKKRPPSYHSS